MTSDNLAVQERHTNLTFESLKDWPGTGRADLHRGRNQKDTSRPITYWSIKKNIDGRVECVGEIFHDDTKLEIENAFACLEVIKNAGLPTDPNRLKEVFSKK